MQTLTGSQFNLVQDDQVLAQVQATNAIGQGPLSDVSTVVALVQVVPHKPLSPPYRNENTSATLLQVDFDPFVSPQDGGADILSYHLQYDDASGGAIWTNLLGFDTDEAELSYSVTVSI